VAGALPFSGSWRLKFKVGQGDALALPPPWSVEHHNDALLHREGPWIAKKMGFR
jgi:hypothetical protein